MSSLCPQCTFLCQQPPLDRTRHYSNIDSIVAAAQDGCMICGALNQDILIPNRQEIRDRQLSPYSWASFHSYIPSTLSSRATVILCVAVVAKDGPVVGKLAANPQKFLLVQDGGAEPAVRASLAGNEDDLQVPRLVPCFQLDVAKSWLHRCYTHHKECSRPANLGDPPLRLLDLAGDRVRLVDVDKGEAIDNISSVTSRPHYATLSHCWGPNADFVTLSAGNLGDFKKDLPLRTLPANFQDAIAISRSLGFRYLWIDSLCILQRGPGSSADWLYHSTIMGTIYANSDLTLAASSSLNPHAGLLGEKSRLIESPIPVFWSPDKTSKPFRWLLIRDNFWDQAVNWPLTKRAWAVQERILSPRVLHFGSRQLHWECSEDPLVSEQFPLGLKLSPRLRYAVPWTGEDFLPDFDLPRPGTPGDVVYKSWIYIVRSYSFRSLTYPKKDKLAALAGVAQVFGTLLQDDPVAGVFPKYAIDGLLWRVDEEQGYPRPYSLRGVDCAPSWSWASVDGPIQYWTESTDNPAYRGWKRLPRLKGLEKGPARSFDTPEEGLVGCNPGGASLCKISLETVSWKASETPEVNDWSLWPDDLAAIPMERVRSNSWLMGDDLVVPLVANSRLEIVRGIILRKRSTDGKTYSRIAAFEAIGKGSTRVATMAQNIDKSLYLEIL